jgi:hypothetical protein
MGHARETLPLQRVAPAVQSRLLCRAGIELLIGIYPTRSLQWKGWISLKHCGQRALFFSFLFFFMLQRSKIWITPLRCKPTYGHDRDKSAALATVFLRTVPAYRVTSSRGLQARQIPLCCLLAFHPPQPPLPTQVPTDRTEKCVCYYGRNCKQGIFLCNVRPTVCLPSLLVGCCVLLTGLFTACHACSSFKRGSLG